MPVVVGAGIALGVMMYGWKVMQTIGVKLTSMSASRGFIIETMSSVVIIMGSLQGLPLSTTHCQVGAVVGVGVTETKWLGGKYEPYPEFEASIADINQLASSVDPETGKLTDSFTFQSGDKTVTAHKGWSLLKINDNEFEPGWVEEFEVMGGHGKRFTDEAKQGIDQGADHPVATLKFYGGTMVPGVNWSLFVKIVFSWVMTLVFAGLISAAICSFCVGAKYPVENK